VSQPNWNDVMNSILWWLEKVVAYNGWNPSHGNRLAVMAVSGNIYLEVDLPDCHTSVELTLLWADKAQCYVVSTFRVAGKERLRGSKVMDQFGKRFAEPDEVELKKLPSNIWTVNCPANLEALFRIYDRLSTLCLQQPVFNLPE
jgi:hypothetical protein